MTIPLDDITRKKLILVRQLYQRAILQAESMHSYVDRILAIIGMDLANETVLKAVVGALHKKSGVATEFHPVLQQANDLLLKAGLPEVPNTANILHVHNHRNDAQHKARYPDANEVSDCRTYTRDFLRQIVLNVWGERFESISLVEAVQNPRVKQSLREAEAELAKSEYSRAVLKSIAAIDWTMTITRPSIVKRMPYNAKAIVVTDGAGRQSESHELMEVFEHMRNTIMRSVIGVSFPGYLKFRRITRSVGHITFYDDGGYDMSQRANASPTIQEAEYAVEFATNTIIQIESLVGDIDKPFEL